MSRDTTTPILAVLDIFILLPPLFLVRPLGEHHDIMLESSPSPVILLSCAKCGTYGAQFEVDAIPVLCWRSQDDVVLTADADGNLGRDNVVNLAAIYLGIDEGDLAFVVGDGDMLIADGWGVVREPCGQSFVGQSQATLRFGVEELLDLQ